LFVATEILLPTELRKKIAAAQPAHLIIVPDGALHQLPFELLPTDVERSTYLLDELPPICYAPSLHIYRTLREDANESHVPLNLLSVADPDYNVASDSLAATARDLTSVGQEFHHYWDGRLTRLESAAEELAEVTAAFKDLGQGRITLVPLTESNATEQKLKESLQAQPVHMLHIAAHGLVTQRHNNLFGALALTTQPHPTAEDDGFIALHEVFTLPLRDCDLAVLSACQTNCGPESPLEAGSTLARAFLCAGARRVVSSHWSVSDKATAPLIGGFMRNVARDLRTRDAVDYAAALHAAKLRLRNESQTAAPYFWAPFVLIGPPMDASAIRDALASEQ
jgi:CHAT domain-containing protein